MNQYRLSTFVFSAWIGLCACAAAQPERASPESADEALVVPEGFELQELELGGQILKPIGWKYDWRDLGSTLAHKLWEPLPDDPESYDTCLTIDIATPKKDTKIVPSEYAASYIEALKQEGKVIKELKPQKTNGLTKLGILMDQKMTMTDAEKEYRIQTTIFADDDSEMLYVFTGGTLVSQWDTYEPTFRVMTRTIKVFDLTKEEKAEK
jgi:hypothetical protein